MHRLSPENYSLQDVIGDAAHQEDSSIKSRRSLSEVILSHPRRGEGNEGEPEEEMQVCPQDRPVYFTGGVEHVVVIVPVNPQHDEAEDISEELRP